MERIAGGAGVDGDGNDGAIVSDCGWSQSAHAGAAHEHAMTERVAGIVDGQIGETGGIAERYSAADALSEMRGIADVDLVGARLT